jgi:hypothetical protein
MTFNISLRKANKREQKIYKKNDWAKVDAIPEDSYDYNEAPELTKGFLKLAFIHKPLHKKLVTLRLDDDIQ